MFILMSIFPCLSKYRQLERHFLILNFCQNIINLGTSFIFKLNNQDKIYKLFSYIFYFCNGKFNLQVLFLFFHLIPKVINYRFYNYFAIELFLMSAEIQKYISEIVSSLSLISRRIEFETLQERISSKTLECENPDIWKDQSLAKGLMRERQTLLEQFETYSKLINEFDDIKTLFEIAGKEKDEVLLIELENSFSKLREEVAEIEVLSLLDGEADTNDAFLEINSGAGGTESCD